MADRDADPKFSDVCGENVELSANRKRAKWCHVYSAGRIFASRQLVGDESLDVLLDGSGHMGMGIIKCDPSLLRDIRDGVTGSCMPKHVTDIRVHKRECSVGVQQRKEDKATKLFITYSGQKVVVKIKHEEAYWLTFELKFGSIVVKFNNPGISFHQNAGRNVTFLDKERRSAKLEVEYPAVTCCLWRKLHMNEYVTFSVLPLKDKEKDLSTYHVVLGVSQLAPAQLRGRDPESFKADSRAPLPYRWRVINRFDKDVCYGELRVGVSPKGRVRAFHSGGFETEMDLDTEMRSSQYLFVLSLFRTEVRIKDLVVEETHYDYAVQSFRKASKRYNTDALYVDVIDDDAPVNGDQQNKQDLRRMKSRSFPMALPTQMERDDRSSLALNQPAENYYDDIALGSPLHSKSIDFPNVTPHINAVYCDVIGDGVAESSEFNRDTTSEKADCHYDEVDFEKNANSKQTKKNNKSPHMIKKPVSKLLGKVQGIKNVFVKRAEHPYDEIGDDEIKNRKTKNNFGNTLISVLSKDEDVVENTYWEVKEIPRSEKENQAEVTSSSEKNVIGSIKSTSNSSESAVPFIKVSDMEQITASGITRIREQLGTHQKQGTQQCTGKSESETKLKSDDSSMKEEHSGNKVNVKLLIQKFAGNENEAGKIHSCAIREKKTRAPLLHISPSAPLLVMRSKSDESLGLSRSISDNPAVLQNQNDAQLAKKPNSESTSDIPHAKEESGVLNETFDSINLLLNIGKEKKPGKKNKTKEKKK
ncbi:uncharacterized protein LOC125660952 [Ostrea edulis]|uniref:uncharacterized protein LOC125660952 n=1 Tax=Ostrea edulis TaxID=37623 RepID=UPI0024AF3A71|nr:uncharacterized protein LOC125660952 [Ostrea edulis]